jgi:hypothetical protein
MATRTALRQLSRANAALLTRPSQRRPPRPVTAAARSLATTSPTPTPAPSGGGNGTAIVLLNMGGPSTVPEVYNFLSRLFVPLPPLPPKRCPTTTNTQPGRRRPDPTRPAPKVPRPPNRPAAGPQNRSAVRHHRRRLTHPALVRASSLRNVQAPRQDPPGDRPAQAVRCVPLRRAANGGYVPADEEGRRQEGCGIHAVPAVLVFHHWEQLE